MRFNTLNFEMWGMVEGMKNKLSDKRKVAGSTWAELRESAMKPDFKSKSAIYANLDYSDKKLITALIEAQLKQANQGGSLTDPLDPIEYHDSDYEDFDDEEEAELEKEDANY